MLLFDQDLYVTKNMILIITSNISLISIINILDTMRPFNFYNMLHHDQFHPHIFYYN